MILILKDLKLNKAQQPKTKCGQTTHQSGVFQLSLYSTIHYITFKPLAKPFSCTPQFNAHTYTQIKVNLSLWTTSKNVKFVTVDILILNTETNNRLCILSHTGHFTHQTKRTVPSTQMAGSAENPQSTIQRTERFYSELIIGI